MKQTMLFNFLVDKENKKINVEKSFDAPVNRVWDAWTNPEILDRWWAPKPWRCETKSMNFTEGGRWHYAMVGPNGERQWCNFDFKKIEPQQSFSGSDAFSDENAVPNDKKPMVNWDNTFSGGDDDSTVVNVELSFKSASDLEELLKMGFKEGFTMGLQNLDEYLQSK